jgi:hypothetical protein
MDAACGRDECFRDRRFVGLLLALACEFRRKERGDRGALAF